MVPSVVTHSPEVQATIVLVGTGLAAMLLTIVATDMVRTHAIRRAMFDVPNQRSSHTVPTPRGGGAAIVAVVLLSIALGAAVRILPSNIAAALFGGGTLVAAIGWLDDRHNVKPSGRAAVHVCAAAWAVYWVGGLGPVHLGRMATFPGSLERLLWVLAIAWTTNLYNFMDGIDGIAAVETIIAGSVGAGILLLGSAFGMAFVSATLGGAAAGFLVWNRMPARVFMGDVGSGFLGFIFAVIALAATHTGVASAIVWVMLLLTFITDASVTLMRRALRGESWTSAHRLHAYQRLVQSGLNHAQVVRLVVLIDGLLAILAVTVFLRPHLTWPALVIGLLIVGASYMAVERRKRMWA